VALRLRSSRGLPAGRRPAPAEATSTSKAGYRWMAGWVRLRGAAWIRPC